MAVEEKQKQSIAKNEENKYHYHVTPRYSAWTDDDKVILRVALPGVKKDNIEMKALPDLFMLRASRDDILYVLDLELNNSIVPEKTKVEYNEGLLRVEMLRENPLDKAYLVSIK